MQTRIQEKQKGKERGVMAGMMKESEREKDRWIKTRQSTQFRKESQESLHPLLRSSPTLYEQYSGNKRFCNSEFFRIAICVRKGNSVKRRWNSRGREDTSSSRNGFR